MLNQTIIYDYYLEKALYFNTIDYNQFLSSILPLLSGELVLIISIILYLCIIKNFNSFYVSGLFFYAVLIFELILMLKSGQVNYPTQLFFLSSFSFDFYSTYCKLFIISFLILIITFSEFKLILKQPTISDTYMPIFFFLFFSLILLSSCDFLLSYLSLEGVSLSLYVLAANTYHKRVAIEATVKYFVSGGVSSGLFIYGNSIIFGLFGTSNYIEVKHLLSNTCAILSPKNGGYISEVSNVAPIEVSLALICFIITFLFKVAAFPCHMWSPDVYEGLWLPVTVILIILVKLLYFFFFFKVFFYVFINLVYL
jgi:NADH:ubiquinone oxidoreductase subunit 2 (subunit N)